MSSINPALPTEEWENFQTGASAKCYAEIDARKLNNGAVALIHRDYRINVPANELHEVIALLNEALPHNSVYKITSARIDNMKSSARLLHLAGESEAAYQLEEFASALTSLLPHVNNIEDEILPDPLTNLSIRTRNSLSNGGILTFKELARQFNKKGWSPLLSLKNFGRKSMHEVESLLIQQGVTTFEESRTR